MSIHLYTRFLTPEITIGTVKVGGDNPVLVQSMTNTDTNNIEQSVEQCVRIFNAGGHAVRLTAQGVKEAENLKKIRSALHNQGFNQPLIADIHFNPKAALVAAEFVEKVRINPGNYVGSKSKFTWTDKEYANELEKIRENLLPLIAACKKYHTAIRVGVNHGSLSQRILAKYGDTPEGMVESMMEFLRIFKAEGFYNVVCSVKSSNTRTMVYAYRLLAHTMLQENCVFPLHLGVTEAGADEDGRIKSAVGIGTLLLDGIGDTIRVSLTEAPEKEIPVCNEIISYRNQIFKSAQKYSSFPNPRKSLFSYCKHNTKSVSGIGADAPPVVFSCSSETTADWYIQKNHFKHASSATIIPIVSCKDYAEHNFQKQVILRISANELNHISQLQIHEQTILLIEYSGDVCAGVMHSLYSLLQNNNICQPVLLHVTYTCKTSEVQIKAAIDAGSLLLDGFLDGVCISHTLLPQQECVELTFSILQASRARFTKTEYIACPSCGRTLFNIEKALREVKEKTSHLTGLKIAVMGCVVNGPGEMADADFGYIGAGRGMVHLYKKQELIQKNVPEERAIQTLLDIIEND